MTNKLRYTIRRLLEIKHDAQKFMTIFNVLPNLIYPLTASCESTTVLYTTLRHAHFGVILQCLFCCC